MSAQLLLSLLLPLLLLPSCSTPPTASLPLVGRPAPSPLHPSLPHIPAAALRSPPTQSDIHAPSPAHHSVPQTRCSRPRATVPGLQSGTSAPLPLPLPLYMGPAQTSPPSAPPGSDTHAPPPLLQCVSPPPRPLAPALPDRPKCRSACSQSASL